MNDTANAEVRQRFLCWCDGEPTCHGDADHEFGLCAPCRQLGHSPLPAVVAPDHAALDSDVERVFEEFWRPIVMAHGLLDIDQVKKELHDYYVAIQEVSKVYDEITGGRFSKPNTSAANVLEAHEEWCWLKAGPDDEIAP